MKRRLLCFTGSALFHALAILLTVLFFAPVEFHVYENVADVIIVPPLKIPSSSAERAAEEAENFLVERGIRIAPQLPPGQDVAEGDLASPRTARQPGAVTGGKASSLPPEMASDFRLDSLTEEKGGFSLNITPEKKGKAVPAGEIPPDLPDFRRHLGTSTQPTRPLGSYRPGKPGAALSTRSRGGAGQASEYDITPWAEEVVSRIQRNWIIPAANGSYEKRSVEIAVVIDRSGKIFSLGIRNSSSKPYLDSAALHAVKMSVPFPALPDDFPLERMEAAFLFQYYE